MKKVKLFKITVLVLILAGSFSSCSEKVNNADEESATEEPATIIGKWKLTKVTLPFTPTGSILHDYSRYSIVYEFNTNGILTVSGETGNIDWYRGHETGEYPYSIIDEDESKEAVGFAGFRLKINTLYYSYSVTYKELIIDDRALDGYLYIFVKINQ